METLPTDILRIIFGYCSEIADYQRLSHTCRRLRAVAKESRVAFIPANKLNYCVSEPLPNYPHFVFSMKLISVVDLTCFINLRMLKICVEQEFDLSALKHLEFLEIYKGKVTKLPSSIKEIKIIGNGELVQPPPYNAKLVIQDSNLAFVSGEFIDISIINCQNLRDYSGITAVKCSINRSGVILKAPKAESLVIVKTAIEDTELSCDSLKVWEYLSSHIDTKNIRTMYLTSNLIDTIHIRNAIKELVVKTASINLNFTYDEDAELDMLKIYGHYTINLINLPKVKSIRIYDSIVADIQTNYTIDEVILINSKLRGVNADINRVVYG